MREHLANSMRGFACPVSVLQIELEDRQQTGLSKTLQNCFENDEHRNEKMKTKHQNIWASCVGDMYRCTLGCAASTPGG